MSKFPNRRGLVLFIPLLAASKLAAQSRVDFGAPRAPLNEPATPLSDAPPPADLGKEAEVYVVSGYESKHPRTTVQVDRPGRRVLLVLTSYEKVFWQVRPTAGTTLAGVLVASYTGDSALQAPAGVPAFRVKLPYAAEVDNANFRTLLAQLNAMFALQRVDGVRGAYSLPSSTDLRQPDPPRPQLTLAGEKPQEPQKDFSFTLLGADLRPIAWSLRGPKQPDARRYLETGKVALAPDGQRVWLLQDDGLHVLRRGETTAREIPLPPDFPRFSWAMDLAHDGQRGVLTVVSLGGEGFLYRYDTRRERWLDVRSLKDIDIQSLAFDPLGDRYVAWTSYGDLLLVSPEGHGLMQRRVLQLLPGYGALYDRGNASAPRLTLAPHGDQLALVAILSGRPRRVWVYDWQRNTAQMTWRSED